MLQPLIKGRRYCGTTGVSAAILFLLLAVTCGTVPAFATGADDFLDFARRTAGKYAAEVPSSQLRASYTFRVRAIPMDAPSRAKYDAERGVVVIAYTREHARLGAPLVNRRCKNGARYVANNAFNAKVVVTKQSCEAVQLRGPDEGLLVGLTYHDIFGLKFRGTQEDVRRLKRDGYEIELEVKVGVPEDKDYLTIGEEYSEEPSFSSPYEIVGRGYMVYGNVTAIRFYLVGSKTPFATQDPHPKEDAFAEEP